MTNVYCNICGKMFDEEDEYSGGKISSNVDDIITMDLCSLCYRKLINSLKPQCAIEPYEDDEDCDFESENDSSDYDFDGELN